MPAVWYSRTFNLPESWSGKNVRLHFGAVDYHATVWINGEEAGRHKGGYSSFWLDITQYLKQGENIVTVYAQDDLRSGNQPGGKQSINYHSQGCHYTRTTGIWQTVWMEAVDTVCIDSVKMEPNLERCSVNLSIQSSNEAQKAEVEVTFKGRAVGGCTIAFNGSLANAEIMLSEKHPWSVGEGNLYDVSIKLYSDDNVTDEVQSYFGLRSISWNKKGITLNGEYVFQRLVLDQGFYPDGIYTAPTDEDLKKDIELSFAMGFNGARLHEKIFEPRFLYWADKLGYMCWEEHANWGLNITTMDGLKNFLPEWIEAINRDYNHPSIVGWCPFNETWDWKSESHGLTANTPQNNDVLHIVYTVTKQMDPARPVIDTSGNFHVCTDIYDIHTYMQDPQEFAHMLDPDIPVRDYINFADRQASVYDEHPFFISEYGGIRWSEDESGWGYGESPKSTDEFIQRYNGLTSHLLNNPNICAFCYTQLYDVEQEQNGLYTYDRKPKFDPKVIAEINMKKAAIER
jgi:beta-galactosidase/beta-glucuronidase